MIIIPFFKHSFQHPGILVTSEMVFILKFGEDPEVSLPGE